LPLPISWLHFPSFDPKTKKYNLGKGLIPAQECFDAVTTFNPTYELAYWSWALQKAQEWKQRLGLPRDKKWDEIINNLAPLPQLIMYISLLKVHLIVTSLIQNI
jgi:hypothetical protein